MIQLFNVPKYTIDSSKFSNLLHDPIRDDVEKRVAKFVGADYAVAVSSCTDGIFLTLKLLGNKKTCIVPSLITTRFLSAIVHAGCHYAFEDNESWVGHDYLLQKNYGFNVYDSAQRFDPDQFAEYGSDDIAIFSNYPTKPLGGLKGGFVVSNNKDAIDLIRQGAYFGEKFSKNSWDSSTGFMGWQKYMNSVEADFVSRSLKAYPHKRMVLDIVRDTYLSELTVPVVTGDSYHLFRIKVDNNRKFMDYMASFGIATGIHYTCAHLDPVYGAYSQLLPRCETDAKTVVSIPFHDALSNADLDHIIKTIDGYEYY